MIDKDLLRLLGDKKKYIVYTVISMVIGLCAKIRAVRPEATFGADFICGFPTESEEAFMNTVRLVEEAGIGRLHVFPYSERPGTPAALMPQVPVEVRRKRAKILREKGEAVDD